MATIQQVGQPIPLHAEGDRPKTVQQGDVIRHQVFLVPGFMGFHQLGEQPYFSDVEPMLLRDGWAITRTDTVVTAGIQARAVKLAQEVAAHLIDGVEHVHFVGHSTGGIDVRLMLSPGHGALRDAELAPGHVWDRAAPETDPSPSGRLRYALNHTRSAIGLATPHRGSPLADVASTIGIAVLLRRLGALAGSRPGRWAARGVFTGVKAAVGGITRVLPTSRLPLLHALQGGLLAETPDALSRYFGEIGVDTAALVHLSTASMAALGAALVDRDGVFYGDAVTITPPPAMRDVPLGLLGVTTPIYWLARQVAGGEPAYPYLAQDAHDLTRQVRADAAFDTGVDPAWLVPVNAPDPRWGFPGDGIVPTYSQVHGEIVAVVASDHLDCIGFYPHCRRILTTDGPDIPDGGCPPNHPAMSGWVSSGAGYRNRRHKWLWTRIAEAMERAAG